MSQRRGRSLTAILLALVGGFILLYLAVAILVGGSASIGATLSNGRNVTVQSNSWYISAESNGDTCTTRTAGRTIVIAGDTVSVDGRKLATMDPATKDMHVSVDKEQILFVADGATIATCPR